MGLRCPFHPRDGSVYKRSMGVDFIQGIDQSMGLVGDGSRFEVSVLSEGMNPLISGRFNLNGRICPRDRSVDDSQFGLMSRFYTSDRWVY